jgi:hypothetical protein
MMSNAHNHAIAARPLAPAAAGDRDSSTLEWVLKRIQGVMCGLQGHDSVLQYERTRMFLRCTSCGHETPGWEVTPGTLVMNRRAESRPARAVARELGIVRKIA